VKAGIRFTTNVIFKGGGMIELTDEQKREFFQNWHNQWIQPELERRFGTDGVPETFQMRECLITFPTGKTPKVQFNKEFGWMVEQPHIGDRKKLPDFAVGEPVSIYQILSIKNVIPPTIDGERLAFMYLYWDGFEYRLFVDFLPNQPDYDPKDERFAFRGEAVAQHLQDILIEKVVVWAKQHIDHIRQIGLWIATPLLPYPLSKIVERIDAGDPESARQILVEYCDFDFISRKLVETWSPINAFKARQSAFDQALQSHRNAYYEASISILINHVEGVIVDWLHETNPTAEVKWRTNARIKQFESVLERIPRLPYAFREALATTIKFLQLQDKGAPTPYQAFQNWLETTDPNFPSRHAISHGKYIPEIYNAENSIKLFLLLDTLCQFMMFYEARVLNRELHQPSDLGGDK
jgi:hypothetical protein